MIYLELFVTFLKIGAFAFGGGYAVLPLIQQYVVAEKAWINLSEMTDLISISQITPGPIAINSATFIGTKVAGVPGAIVATLGNVLPQFILMMILGHFLFGGKDLPFLGKILKGLRPVIAGLVSLVAITMIKSTLFVNIQSFSSFQFNYLGLIGFAVGLYFYAKGKLGIVGLVILSVVIGLGVHAISLLF